jgi:hypothetical protein
VRQLGIGELGARSDLVDYSSIVSYLNMADYTDMLMDEDNGLGAEGGELDGAPPVNPGGNDVALSGSLALLSLWCLGTPGIRSTTSLS